MSFVMIDPEAPAEALEAPSNALDVSSVQPTWEALEFYGPADRRIHHPELVASAAASDQCPLTGTALDESAIIDELHDMFDLIVEAPAAQAFESFVPEPVELDSDERETALYDDELLGAPECHDDIEIIEDTPADDLLDDFASFDEPIVEDTRPEPETAPLAPPPLPEVVFEAEPLLPELGHTGFDNSLFADADTDDVDPFDLDEFAPADPGTSAGLGSADWDLIHQESRRTPKAKAPRRKLFSAGLGRAEFVDEPPIPASLADDEDESISIAERLATVEINLMPVPSLDEEAPAAPKPIDLAEILQDLVMPCDLAPIPGEPDGFGSRQACFFTTLYRTLEVGVAIQKALNTMGMKLQTISPGRAVASDGTNTLLVSVIDNAKSYPTVPVYSIVLEIELV